MSEESCSTCGSIEVGRRNLTESGLICDDAWHGVVADRAAGKVSEGRVVRLACSRCGGELVIPKDDFDLAVAQGHMIPTTHVVCPVDDPALQRLFRVEVSIFEVFDTNDQGDALDYTLMASVATEARHVSFRDAVLVLSRDLNDKWNTLVQRASIADAPRTEEVSE